MSAFTFYIYSIYTIINYIFYCLITVSYFLSKCPAVMKPIWYMRILCGSLITTLWSQSHSCSHEALQALSPVSLFILLSTPLDFAHSVSATPGLLPVFTHPQNASDWGIFCSLFSRLFTWLTPLLFQIFI